MITIKSIVRRQRRIFPIYLSLFIPISVFAQYSNASNAKLSLTPFIGIGINNGRFKHSLPEEGYIQPVPMKYERIWHLKPGYSFTLKLLLEKTSPSRNEQNNIIILGILIGSDLSLIPNRINRIESPGDPPLTPINARFNQDVFYIGPSITLGLRFIPAHLLFAAGPNYSFWEKSNLNGLNLKNCAGLSFLGIVRYGSLWAGISIHYNSTKAIKDNMFGGPNYKLDLSSKIIWINLGFSGW